MFKFTGVLTLLVTQIYVVGRSITIDLEDYNELLGDYELVEAKLSAAKAKYSRVKEYLVYDNIDL